MFKKINPYWLYAVKNIQMVAVTVLLMSLCIGGLALLKANAAIRAAHGAVEERGVTYTWSKNQLSAEEYENIMISVRTLHPSVQVAYTPKDGFVLSLKDGTAHADWLFALGSLHARDKDIVWEASEFCVGRCQGGLAARAKVVGYRQALKTK